MVIKIVIVMNENGNVSDENANVSENENASVSDMNTVMTVILKLKKAIEMGLIEAEMMHMIAAELIQITLVTIEMEMMPIAMVFAKATLKPIAKIAVMVIEDKL
jgi:hypothetical protein